MHEITAFIKLQMKLRWGKDGATDKKSTAVTFVIGLLTVVVMLGLLFVFSGILVQSFNGRLSAEQISIVFITVIEAVLAVAAVGSQIKWLLKPHDINITARFPISSFQMFIANLAMIYLNLFIYALMLMVPIMSVFALAAEIFTFRYFIGLIIASAFAPAVPFAVSTLIAIPVMYILTVLENHNYVKLVIFVVALVAFFIAYDYLLNVMAEYFINQKVSNQTVDIWDKIIAALSVKANVSVFLNDIIYLQNMLKSILILLAAFAVFSAAGIFAAKLVYDRVRYKALEGVRTVYNKVTKENSDSPYLAIFKREFKEIMRTRIYAYFYLGIAVATPVMVFFCDRLVSSVGQAQLGGSIGFGTSLLVISAFMAMINVFAASAISREGQRFYISKIIPVRFTAQLLVKGSLNLIVAAGALIISCFVIGKLGFVTPEQVAVIIVVELLLSLAFIFNGFNLNLRHPHLRNKANGDVNETNVTTMMITGIFLSAVLGGVAIIVSFSSDVSVTYYISLAVTVIYLVINAAVFFRSAEKKYYSIES